jgi:hypothetical protein
MINEGDNFYIIENNIIRFWGQNINIPFEIKINDDIKRFIKEKEFHINEVCELNEDNDLELYRKCLSYIDNKIFDDERVLLMNQLELLGVNKEDARELLLLKPVHLKRSLIVFI